MAPVDPDIAASAGSANLHTVFTSECQNPQFDWFSLGVYASFRNAQMRGSITRLLACSPDDLANYSMLDIGPTFVHPNYRHNPLNGDVSASYNKPASVMHWVREANFTEEYVLFIDADMIINRPIDPIAMGARRGVVVSERVGYLIGTKNGLAEEFIPEDAVPRAKPVGWYHIFHRDDLREIAPLWLKYCGEVRMHPERYWAIDGSIERDIPTGDMYVERGKAPWIAEMYGYSFGAAVAGVDHVVTQGVVMYPRDVLGKHKTPHIIHYGIDFSVGNRYTWNKMSFKQLDVSRCQGRYFGVPPKPIAPRDKIGAKVVNTLNAAFCEFYRARCPTPPDECPPTERSPDAPKRECDDDEDNCWQWAMSGECEKNPGFMGNACKRSCGKCRSPLPLPPPPSPPPPPPSPPPSPPAAEAGEADIGAGAADAAPVATPHAEARGDGMAAGRGESAQLELRPEPRAEPSRVADDATARAEPVPEPFAEAEPEAEPVVVAPRVAPPRTHAERGALGVDDVAAQSRGLRALAGRLSRHATLLPDWRHSSTTREDRAIDDQHAMLIIGLIALWSAALVLASVALARHLGCRTLWRRRRRGSHRPAHQQQHRRP